MVVFQFAVSIVLIAETIIVFQQIQHAKNRPVGFDREGIFHVEIRTDQLAKTNYNSLRDELLKTGVVENMAISDFPITGSASADASLTWQGKGPALRALVAMNSCTHDFPKTNGFQFVEGRDFSRDHSTDSAGVIVNELAANLISKDHVIGKKIKFGSGPEREIIGVIRDQIRSTPFVKQTPQLYYINYANAGYITVRLQQNTNVNSALTKVEATIRKFDEGAPFDFKFINEDYARLFKAEERIGNLASVFSFLTVMISSIGIFGLAAFASSQRTKEIGIRKVLGASALGLWIMLSGDFVKLVMVSVLIGMPLAYYLANEWLQQYDYRIDVSWSVFVVTGLSALAVTLITVSFQALKAAMMNPVDSIRTE
jgi:ABC-type antimicrobial peptide transport system permease subunit